jgi:hypothetical protein
MAVVTAWQIFLKRANVTCDGFVCPMDGSLKAIFVYRLADGDETIQLAIWTRRRHGQQVP